MAAADRTNAALYRVVIVRTRGHRLSPDDVRQLMTAGKSKSEIILCLERFVAGEIFDYLCCPAGIRDTASASP